MYILGSHRGHCDKRPPVGVQHGEELPITFSEEKIQTALKNIIFRVQYKFLDFLKALSHHFQLPLSQRQRSMTRKLAPEKQKA